MSAPISVITIVKNRTEKLCNLINQLEACSTTPNELLIVWMTPPSDLSLITSDKFNIEHKFVNQKELPIAKARNKGLFEAKNELLAYISVDTIFSPSCFEEVKSALAPSSVMRAPVCRIPITSRHQHYSMLLNTKSEIHVHKSVPVTQTSDPLHHNSQQSELSTSNNLPTVSLKHDTESANKKDDNHGKFSNDSTASAMFFIRKTDFEKTGGFDETFDGYGLNDEDFFAQCREVGLTLTDSPSMVFSPVRDLTRCPVNHLLDFVHNAQLFREKWGFFPRKDILNSYAEKGLINNDFETSNIHVTRLPNEEEITESEKALEPIDEAVQEGSVVKKRSNEALAAQEATSLFIAHNIQRKPSALQRSHYAASSLAQVSG